MSQRSRSRKSARRPAPLTRTVAVNRRSALVLERKREAGAELHDLAVLDLDVQFLDLGDAQVAQRTGRRLYRVPRGVFPGVAARADHFGNAIDSGFGLARHDRSSSGTRDVPSPDH